MRTCRRAWPAWRHCSWTCVPGTRPLVWRRVWWRTPASNGPLSSWPSQCIPLKAASCGNKLLLGPQANRCGQFNQAVVEGQRQDRPTQPAGEHGGSRGSGRGRTGPEAALSGPGPSPSSWKKTRTGTRLTAPPGRSSARGQYHLISADLVPADWGPDSGPRSHTRLWLHKSEHAQSGRCLIDQDVWKESPPLESLRLRGRQTVVQVVCKPLCFY